MAGTLAELEVNIIGNTKSLDTAIDGSKKTVDKFDKGLNDMAKTVKKLLGAGALIALASKIKDIGKASILAASEAEEVQAKFETAFKGIEDSATTTAEELARVYGLSQTESKKLLGDTGDLLKGFGATAGGALDFSNEIQKLAVDLASYNNVTGGAARVSKILTKSVLGNKDGLSELGVSLLDTDIKQELVRTGQDKLTGQAGKLAKAQATYTLILQQTGDAQGDYIRTSDSFANKTRAAEASVKDLQVELGRALLPTATSVASIFGELTGKLADYIRGINDLRTAEAAQKLGIATKQQNLLLLDLQREKIEDQLVAEKALFEVQDENESFTSKFARDNVRLLNLQLTGKERLIGEIEGEIAVESQLADDKAHQAAVDKTNDQAREQEARKKEQNYKKQIGFIDDVILASKSEIQVIEEEIARLLALDAQDEETRQKQLTAIKLLQEEKQTILDEEATAKEDALLAELTAQQAFDAETRNILQTARDDRAEAEQAAKDKRIADLQEEADFILGIVGNIESIWNNLNESKLNGIEATKNADIAALTTLDEGNLNYAADKLAIEKKAADETYKIKLAEFNANKALALIQIAVDTAIGVAKVYGQVGIYGLAAQIPVIAAGALQAGVVASQTPPPKPQLATGAIIPGSQRGVDVTVGESGNDELILGGGSKGDAILQRFADKINSNGGSGQTVININSLYPPRRQDLDKLARDMYNSNIKEQQRRGI
jgi:hypothetical protein